MSATPCRRWFVASLLLATLSVPPVVSADPPPEPPDCEAKHDDVFCFRFTRFSRDGVTPNSWDLEFEILNWTREDVYGLYVALSTGGTNPAHHTVIGQVPLISSAYIDADGRPIVGPPKPPQGNIPKTNDWIVTAQTQTSVCFSVGPNGTPLPHPTATIGQTTYHGLRDPQFNGAPAGPECGQAIQAMIPGSVHTGGTGNVGDPYCVGIPNQETIDDGNNVLDGFVLELGELEHIEEFSLAWFMLNASGQPVGYFATSFQGAGIIGDPLGFGSLNITPVSLIPGTNTPPPIFVTNTVNPNAVNTGYDPPDNTDPNADKPLFFAEDELNGVDTYLINPIPVGIAGQGTYFGVEPGATVTPQFRIVGDRIVGGIAVGETFFPIGFTPPQTLCTAKSGLVCGLPSISAAGVPSATASSGFLVGAGPARSDKSGILVYNDSSGVGLPFQGGTLCVNPMGLHRAGSTNSMGTCPPAPTGCDGVFSIDMNTFARGNWLVPDCAGNPSGIPPNNPAGFLSAPGQGVFAQYWGRDSMFTGSFVSDMLAWTIGP